MRAPLRILRLVLATIIALIALLTLSGWWVLHRALPQMEGTIAVRGLGAPVGVERDALGVPHIRAQSLDDLLVAQGYVTAQDRLWQMDLLRRAAAGELSEVFGTVTVEHDIESRTLGFTRAAEAAVAAMPQARRAMLEAYARGVNAFIESHSDRLPGEFVVLRYKPRPWSARDTLLISANLYRDLTGFWKDQILRAQVSQAVGPELANDLYAATADSPWDHPLVGLEPEKATHSKPHSSLRVVVAPGRGAPPPVAPESPWSAGLTSLPTFDGGWRGAGGSNNWVVSGSRTRSGRPMLENDTHLGWSVPSVWYLIHLTAPGWNVKGFALPGAPLVVIGHNDHIAWGFTNNFADVLDVYAESFNPKDPLEYRVHGQWQRAATRSEIIRVRGSPDRAVDVILTRHGPVIQRDGLTGYAIRWTATEPGGIDNNFFLLGAARNWDEFRAILHETPGPAQNAVYADTEGHIGFIVSALVPTRRHPTGGVPVPGDDDDYEWTGYIARDELPELLDPPGGIIATANARVTGPSYQWHLTDDWMSPNRVARIYEMLGDRTGLEPEDFIQAATDIYSYPHLMLARNLAEAARNARPADPRTTQLLQSLAGWDGRATTNSIAMSFLEFTRRALLYNFLEPHLHANVQRYQWMRASVFLDMVLRDRPPRWLPAAFRSYDELLISSADLAVRRMAEASDAPDPQRWEWGEFNLLRIFHPLGQSGLLRRGLSIGPLPISGSIYSVKQIARSYGPSMRFVADLSNLDNSLMNITLGQSGQFLSANYKDQFDAWYEGRGISSKFTDAAEKQFVLHHLELIPAPEH